MRLDGEVNEAGAATRNIVKGEPDALPESADRLRLLKMPRRKIVLRPY